MTPESIPGRYLTATTEDGMLIIHGSPPTLSWVPRDVVNDALNVGGIVTVGAFDSVNRRKTPLETNIPCASKIGRPVTAYLSAYGPKTRVALDERNSRLITFP